MIGDLIDHGQTVMVLGDWNPATLAHVWQACGTVRSYGGYVAQEFGTVREFPPSVGQAYEWVVRPTPEFQLFGGSCLRNPDRRLELLEDFRELDLKDGQLDNRKRELWQAQRSRSAQARYYDIAMSKLTGNVITTPEAADFFGGQVGSRVTNGDRDAPMMVSKPPVSQGLLFQLGRQFAAANASGDAASTQKAMADIKRDAVILSEVELVPLSTVLERIGITLYEPESE